MTTFIYMIAALATVLCTGSPMNDVLPGFAITDQASCSSAMNFDSTITLPIVIHVMHTGTPVGSADNPSDTLIMDLIGLLNDAFRKNGPMYGGADMQIEFALAIRSPDCSSTTGINRVDASVLTNYNTGGITFDTFSYPNSVHEVFVKGLSLWPNVDYINIWIVNRIDGDSLAPGGFAYFPEYNGAAVDGLVLQASVVNGENKTAVHEFGHFFALYHTFGEAWGECIEESDCTTEGDWVCDTENCMYSTTCSETINPCTNEEWIIADAEHGYTVKNNYMDYTDCAYMFTEGQKTRVHDAIATFRPGLLSSGALDEPDSSFPELACIPAAVNGLSPFYGIELVEFGALKVYSNTSDADGSFYVDRTCNQRVDIMAGDSVPLRIVGSYENYQRVRVYLDFDNDGSFDLPEELVLSEDGGVVEDTVIIPLSAMLCAPLRLRVVTDHPAAPEPTGCLLTGTPEDGVGQIEDYAVNIRPRMVHSITSGSWDNAAIWSCGCVPGASDIVTISAGHQVAITQAMGLIECIEVMLENSAELDVDGDLRVKGGCE